MKSILMALTLLVAAVAGAISLPPPPAPTAPPAGPTFSCDPIYNLKGSTPESSKFRGNPAVTISTINSVHVVEGFVIIGRLEQICAVPSMGVLGAAGSGGSSLCTNDYQLHLRITKNDSSARTFTLVRSEEQIVRHSVELEIGNEWLLLNCDLQR